MVSTVKPALTKPTFITMRDLEPGTRVTMHLRVDSVKVLRQRQSWDSDELISVGEAIVGDQYGCSKMHVEGSQFDIVKAGSAITIRNADAKVVKEHLIIEVDKWAKVETSNEKLVAKVNLQKNHSDIEYELVSVQA